MYILTTRQIISSFRFSVGHIWNCCVAYAESEDLRQWTEPTLMLAPDTDDPPLMQFYSATAFPHEGQILGSIERMHMIPDRLDAEIIWSRDGKAWKRSTHRPRFIEWGMPGSFDSAWINLPTNGPIVQETSLFFYYSGRSGAHGAPYPLNHGATSPGTLPMSPAARCASRFVTQKTIPFRASR